MLTTIKNHFHATFSNAKKGLNGYAFVEVPWQRVPGRDDEWKKATLASMNFDTTKFAQEYENEFQGSSGTLIAGWKLKELANSFEVPKRGPLTEGAVFAMVADIIARFCIAQGQGA